ncbi:translation elongation factor Ts [Planctomycetota bacterium]
MAVDASMVKDLRTKTGAGVMACKAALVESNGDVEKAVEVLRKKGIEAAESKAGRKLVEGRIGSYIHFGDRLGVLLEVGCESDFVAKTPEFQELLKDLCMHIAASNPKWLSREDVPEDVLGKEREVYAAQFANKPENVVGKIVEGKLASFFKESCLLEQPYVKDQDTNVGDYIKQYIGKLGENIQVRRFARFAVGE